MQRKIILGVLALAGILSATGLVYAKTRKPAAKRASGVSVVAPVQAAQKLKRASSKKSSAIKPKVEPSLAQPKAVPRVKNKTPKPAFKKTAPVKAKQAVKKQPTKKSSKSKKTKPAKTASKNLQSYSAPFDLSVPMGDGSVLNADGTDALQLDSSAQIVCVPENG